jgi:hypothetical protein
MILEAAGSELRSCGSNDFGASTFATEKPQDRQSCGLKYLAANDANERPYEAKKDPSKRVPSSASLLCLRRKRLRFSDSIAKVGKGLLVPTFRIKRTQWCCLLPPSMGRADEQVHRDDLTEIFTARMARVPAIQLGDISIENKRVRYHRVMAR